MRLRNLAGLLFDVVCMFVLFQASGWICLFVG